MFAPWTGAAPAASSPVARRSPASVLRNFMLSPFSAEDARTESEPRDDLVGLIPGGKRLVEETNELPQLAVLPSLCCAIEQPLGLLQTLQPRGHRGLIAGCRRQGPKLGDDPSLNVGEFSHDLAQAHRILRGPQVVPLPQLEDLLVELDQLGDRLCTDR